MRISGQSSSTTGRVLVYYATDLVLVPSNAYSPQSAIRSDFCAQNRNG